MSQVHVGWTESFLGDVAKFTQGKQIGLNDQSRVLRKGLVRFLRIVDYTQNSDDVRFVKDPGTRYQVSEEDIVMVRYGRPGLIGRGHKGVIANNLFKISIEIEGLSKDYLALFLTQKPIQDFLLTRGAEARRALTFSHLKNLLICYPPLQEQVRIVERLNLLQSKAKYLEDICQKKISALKEFRLSILERAFAGNLDLNVD
jgi:type I restriction enzyme, S subunit